VIPVRETIEGVAFETSLFPKDETYLLPIKVAVRQKLGITADDEVLVEMTYRRRSAQASAVACGGEAVDDAARTRPDAYTDASARVHVQGRTIAHISGDGLGEGAQYPKNLCCFVAIHPPTIRRGFAEVGSVRENRLAALDRS
jgi:hypothetical protein